MKRTILLALLLAVPAAAAEPKGRLPRLAVARDRRHLVTADGKPFFYLGDTAWEVFHRLDRPDARAYLRDRAAKGFTVIQAVVLAEFDGLTVPNAYGHLPLKDNDPTKPVEDYFRHVDWVVNEAEKAGLYVGMLPTWGDKWSKKWGVGPDIFTPANAEKYGEFLGKRYRDRAVIWILGGDRNPETERHRAIIRALAKGLKKGDGGAHLMTYHPSGGANSATWFHKDSWLDFHMVQSGHARRDLANDDFTAANYRLSPPKPTLDGEARYEDHPVNWKPANGWFDDYDARQAAYWSVLAGACGHTYGDHDIWQFLAPGRKPISSARTPWRKALDHPGASQMGILRKLLTARPFEKLVPDQALIVGDAGKEADHVRAARAADGSFAVLYLPTGRPVAVDLGRLSGKEVKAWWFDPRTGKAAPAGTAPRTGKKTWTPPGKPGRGNDWVLVLDDAARGLPSLRPQRR